MADRFEQLYQFPSKLYIEGSPVVIAAGVLLRDQETGSIIAQLKFQSVTAKVIKAVKVSLTAFDVSMSEVQGIKDYHYLDLSISNGQVFGSKKAIVLPINITRSFLVSSICTVFSDGSKWESDEQFSELPSQDRLAAVLPNNDLEAQYRISVNQKAQYAPIESKGLWACSCGTWNGESACSCCEIARSSVFEAYNVEYLTAALYERLIQEAEQQRIREELEKERKEVLAKERKIRTKKLLLAMPIVLCLTCYFWLWPQVVQPIISYNEACKLVEQGNYEQAIAIYENLGEYKDSANQIAKATTLMNEKQYGEALDLLRDASGTSDDEILSALSLVMSTCVNRRFECANDPSLTDDKDYYRACLEAESDLLETFHFGLENWNIENAFLSYVRGLRYQQVVYDNYIRQNDSDFSKLNSEHDWLEGQYIRAEAIIILCSEGVLDLTDEDYGYISAVHIERIIEESLAGTLSLYYEDEDHYSIVVPIQNDTLANFEHFAVWTYWNDEEVYADTDDWKAGSTWNMKLFVPSNVLESDSVSLHVAVDYKILSAANSFPNIETGEGTDKDTSGENPSPLLSVTDNLAAIADIFAAKTKDNVFAMYPDAVEENGDLSITGTFFGIPGHYDVCCDDGDVWRIIFRWNLDDASIDIDTAIQELCSHLGKYDSFDEKYNCYKWFCTDEEELRIQFYTEDGVWIDNE